MYLLINYILFVIDSKLYKMTFTKNVHGKKRYGAHKQKYLVVNNMQRSKVF